MNITHWFTGVVEDINDPSGQGRVRVRCFGYHTPNRALLPTEDLPWSAVILPTNSLAAANAVLLPNMWVFGFFRDGSEQQDSVVLGIFNSQVSSQIFNSEANEGFGSLSLGEGVTSYPRDATSFGTGGGAQAAQYGSGTLVSAGSGAYIPTTGFDESVPPPTLGSSFKNNLISITNSQLGVVETSNNQGAGIEKYWTATSYGPSGYSNREPWCAAFVSWCIKTAGMPEQYLPNSASAFGYRSWATGKAKAITQIRKHPRVVYAGDIVIFTFSHIEIAVENSVGNKVKTIGGNTSLRGEREGSGVSYVNRTLSSISDAITINI